MVRGYSIIDRSRGMTGAIKYCENNVFVRFFVPRDMQEELVLNLVEFFKAGGFQVRPLFGSANLHADSRSSPTSKKDVGNGSTGLSRDEYILSLKQSLTDRQKDIINLLKTKECYQSEIASEFGLIQVQSCLKKLLRLGKIEICRQEGRRKIYRVVVDAEP